MVRASGTSPVCLVIWSVSSIWLNQTNQIDQINQMNKRDQTDRTDQMNKTGWRIFFSILLEVYYTRANARAC